MATGCYVHVPFCSGGKCPYCAFYSIHYNREIAYKFVDSAIMQASRDLCDEIETLYFGGGTPICLSLNQIRRLVEGIKDQSKIADDCEITLEASPESLDLSKIELLKELDVNRISIGVQAFSDRLLRQLGRKHNSNAARNAVRKAVKADFEVSLDLMYGIPGQDVEDWEVTLREAVESGINHISLYCLSYDFETPLYSSMKSGEIVPVEEEIEEKMYFRAIEILGDNGFERYELSSFARQNKVSKHNLNYWKGGGYHGIGPSAHGYSPGPPEWVRRANIADVGEYIGRIGKGIDAADFEERLSITQRINEFLMLRLRLKEGFSADDIREALPEIDPGKLLKRMEIPIEMGYLSGDGRRVFIPTAKLFVSDESIVRALDAFGKIE